MYLTTLSMYTFDFSQKGGRLMAQTMFEWPLLDTSDNTDWPTRLRNSNYEELSYFLTWAATENKEWHWPHQIAPPHLLRFYYETFE
jgi:hypothetical protein